MAATGTSKALAKKEDLITEQELLFVAAYAGNAEEAAVAAGYSAASARSSAYKLMQRPRIQAALARKQEALLREVEKRCGSQLGEELAAAGVTNKTIAEALAKIIGIVKDDQGNVELRVTEHEKRGFADVLSAIKQYREITGQMRPKAEDDPNKMVMDEVDGAFVFYRPKWRDKRREHGTVIDAE